MLEMEHLLDSSLYCLMIYFIQELQFYEVKKADSLNLNLLFP
jgi:hypothetical protein